MSRVTEIDSSRLKIFLAFQNDPLQFVSSLLYDGDMVSLRSSRKRPAYVVNSPEFVQEILVGKDDFFIKGRSSSVLSRTIGDGLLTSEHEKHQQQRNYMQPVFYKERIQAYAETVIGEARAFADRLTDGQTLSVSDEMMKLTLTVIAQTMFATNLEERKSELAAAVNDTIERSARTLFLPFILPLGVPTPGNLVHRRAIRTLETMIYEVIDDAFNHPEPYRLSLLGLLMDTKDAQGQGIPSDEMRNQMMTMLLAGHETTANLLTWIWFSLAENPEVEAKFHQELDHMDLTTGSAMENYRKLSYTSLIIQEALRLYPPAWVILRESEREVSLLGETFPPQSTFLISPYALHRNKHVFKDPDVFRPERFADGISKWPRFAYFPFGGGSRSCIGSNFAMMEATLILAVIGKQFRFRRVDTSSVVPEPLISLRIKGGLTMAAYKHG
ncbi:cytochrome P450 [Paenibacillus agricola]|uniref:Cytochrome P450 n=1 Tax=Paenibacillus agricola TaxID=2716264 RepID=A0ABX0IX63_9BACL|nr:cytochrome P450 [Paenibacillus agricola]NHN28268.1 cytochrome P450 [Paenibacillus agricola]